MLDIQKTYREAKAKAKELMQAGRIGDYVKQLGQIHQLRQQMMLSK